MHQHLSESSQQRADRLLAEYQHRRNQRRAARMGLELSGDPLPEPTRWQRIRLALRPWVAGFDNPYMDALAVAFGLYLIVINVLFAAMLVADRHASPTSATALPAEVAPSPVADFPPRRPGQPGGSLMGVADFNAKCRAHPRFMEMRAQLSARDPLTARLNYLNDRCGTGRLYGVAVRQGSYTATVSTDAGTQALGAGLSREGAIFACEQHFMANAPIVDADVPF